MDEEKNLNEAAEEVKDAAENVVNEAADAAEEATAEVVDEVKDTVEETTAEVVDDAKEAAENVVEEVTDAAQDVAQAAEDTVEDAANTVSDAAEDAVDAVSDAAEETADLFQGAAESAQQAVEGSAENAEQTVQYGENTFGYVTKPESKTTKVVIIAVCALITAAIVVLAVIFVPKILNKSAFNKYNQYVDTTGRTVGEIAEMSGMELDEFLESYSLPADMPADTNESSAFNTIPIGKVLEMYQYENMSTVDEAKSFLALPDWVDENTPWGDAIGEAPLKNYVGEDQLDSFLEHYGLKDIANGDTLYKEVRQTVDEADKKEREEYEKQMEELQKQMEEQQAQSDDETQTEAPADDQAQTEQTTDGQAAEQTDAANTEAQPAQ